MALWMHQHVGRLEIEMARVLLVQAMRCTRDGSAYFCNISKACARMTFCELVNHLLQSLALHMLHHQIRDRR